MNKKIKRTIFFLGIFFLFFIKTGHALALEAQYPTIFGFSLNGNSSIADFICYFYGLGTGLAGIIAVGVIAFGGIYYLIDYGRGKFKDEAKTWIKAGILGLLIVVSATLVAYTINPDLSTCKVLDAFLPIPVPSVSYNSTQTSPNFSSYQEIPIGTLTETLLTRTTSCYEFDPQGDPIDYSTVDSSASPITDDGGQTYSSPDYFIPTYKDHDRADCLLQLMDGAQKKAQIISELSAQITKLMNTCSCGNADGSSKCQDTCGVGSETSGGQAGCDQPSACVPGAKCTGACVPDGSPDKGACKPGPPDCCPDGVKDKIEQGPVQVGCEANNGVFNNNLKNIFTASFLPDINNYKIILSENGACGFTNGTPCTMPDGITSGTCQGGTCVASGSKSNCCDIPQKNYNGLNEFRCSPDDDIPWISNGHQSCDDVESFVEKQITVNKKTIILIDQDKWAQLNLKQQLTYFQDKINEVKQQIQQDQSVLDQARTTLSKCYLAVPYVDLLKNFEGTSQQVTIISTQESFSDPVTKQPVDASKYCEGFNYDNSSCLKKCNDECPDTSDKAINSYQSCDNNCQGDDQDCLDQQESCIEKAYSNRPCTQAGGDNSPSNFGDCISSCQNDCGSECAKKFLQCTGEYNTCKSQCTNNSQCVLNNASDCLFGDGAQRFVDCSNQVTDQGNTNYCINSAYLCKNGSDEYAGYGDCSESSTGACSKGYSASFFYDNPKCEKCYDSSYGDSDPYEPTAKGAVCYDKNKPNSSCQTVCPEVTKCPGSSSCPDCPCDQIKATLNFSLSNANSGSTGSAGSAGTPDPQKVSAHEIVGPQCDSYSYNDDPLTFYCENDWWDDPNKEGASPTPLGTERMCTANGEVPVGQTVDDAEKWAYSTIQVATNEYNNIQTMLDDMKKAGDAILKTNGVQNYCGCDAKFDSPNRPICTTGCGYNYTPPYTDPGTGDFVPATCSCTFTACSGSPCSQLIDYLTKVESDSTQLKINFINFYVTMLQEPRSDVMKELTYSRQQTNSCSTVNNAYALNERLFDCTRVMDEQMPPINTQWKTLNNQTFRGYCYGKNMGDVINKSLTDNWFCCQQWQANPTARNQPK